MALVSHWGVHQLWVHWISSKLDDIHAHFLSFFPSFLSYLSHTVVELMEFLTQHISMN